MDPKVYARIVIARFGGREKFFQLHDQRHQDILDAWGQDSDRIGRVVRAHLFVEHYLSIFLESQCSGLAPLDSARLSFAQKTSLLRTDHQTVGFLRPGIKRLNVIRNRVAHTLKAELREEDAEVFKNIPLFVAMRRAGGDERIATGDPLGLLESFAQFAGMMLSAAAAPDAELWSATPAAAEIQAALGSTE